MENDGTRMNTDSGHNSRIFPLLRRKALEDCAVFSTGWLTLLLPFFFRPTPFPRALLTGLALSIQVNCLIEVTGSLYSLRERFHQMARFASSERVLQGLQSKPMLLLYLHAFQGWRRSFRWVNTGQEGQK